MRRDLRVTRKAVAFLAILTLSVVWNRPLTAQPQQSSPSSDQQAQDIQQLKAKLQQLEQMMDEVKGKLNELDGQPPSNHASEGGPNNGLVSAVTSFDAYPTTHAYGAPGLHRLASRLTRRSPGQRARWISMGLP